MIGEARESVYVSAREREKDRDRERGATSSSIMGIFVTLSIKDNLHNDTGHKY